MLKNVWMAALLALALAAARAATPQADELDRRTAELAHQLRCVVCQNQTIADSQAELALDLRREVRAQLSRGRSEQQVIDYMVERYGEFVLYRPPLSRATLLLWGGPGLLLGAGLLALALRVRRQAPAAPPPDLAEARRLLDGGERS